MTRAEKKAHNDRMNALKAAAREQVAKGCCPQCGAGIHHNNSISGWWQCDRSGSDAFRRDKTGAHCTWQTFTE